MTTAWSDEARGAFIQILLSEAQKLGRIESGFKMQTWTRILNRFNAARDKPFSKAQLQSHLQQLKKKYVVYAALMANSGFGRCPSTGRPTAPDSVWDEYISKHPEAKQFRDKALLNYSELREMFEGVTASGRHAKSSGIDQTNHNSDDAFEETQCTQSTLTPVNIGTSATPSCPSTPGTRPTQTTLATPNCRAVQTAASAPSTPSSPISSHALTAQDVPSIHTTPTPGTLQSKSTPPTPDTPCTLNFPGIPTSSLGRRRRTSGERISAALEQLVEHQGRRVRQRARSQVQIAIASVMEDHCCDMSVAERIHYVNYFVSNPVAAEAFNVLDRDTKVAYLSSIGL